MRAIRWAASIAIVVTLLLSPAGCRSEPDSDGGTDSDGGGAPINRDDDGEAPSSPLDIPNITISQGQPVDAVRERLEAEITKRCGGGELCVTLEVEARDVDPFTECQFVTTDPSPGTTVQRGSVVVIVTGALPCEPSPSTDGGDGETEDPGDTGDPGDTEEPAPEHT